MALISSSDLSARACSITSWPSCSTMPSASSAATPSRSALSSASRRLPPPWARTSVGDLGRPAPGVLGDPRAAVEVVPGARRPDLVDQREVLGQMRAAVEVEQDHRPLGRDEGVAHRVVQAPDLHVGAVGGVAQVDRVADHDPGVVARRRAAARSRARREARSAARSGSSRPSARHSSSASAPGPRSPNEPCPARRAAAATILER